MARTPDVVVTKETLGRLSAVLDELRKMPPVSAFSQQQAIWTMRDRIAVLRKQGYSFAAIAEQLESSGLDISGNAFARQINSRKRRKDPAVVED